MSSRLLVALAAAAAVAGCSDPAAGQAEVRFALAAPADVLLIRLEIQPANLVEDIPITQAAPAIFRNVTVPVGRQTVTATAFAGPDLQSLVRIGSATATVDVVAGATATVSLTILDERGPGGPGDRAPIVTSLVAPAALTSGASAAVSATATDLDGDPIAWAWTAAPAGCGSFAAPAAAATTFTAGAAGDCLVTATATAGGKSDAASRTVAIAAATGGVGVTGQFIARPVVSAVAVAGGGLPATGRVVDRADATLATPLSGGRAVGVRVEWARVASPVAVEVTDTCSGQAHQPAWTGSSGPVDSATFTWDLPAPPAGQSAACGVTASVVVVAQPSLRDDFAAGLEVLAPPAVPDCALPAPVITGIGYAIPANPFSASPPAMIWSDASGETAFEIGRAFTAGGAIEPLATVGLDTTRYVDAQIVAPGPVGYCYRCAYAVRALSPPCASAWSEVAVAPGPPPAPGGPLPGPFF